MWPFEKSEREKNEEFLASFKALEPRYEELFAKWKMGASCAEIGPEVGGIDLAFAVIEHELLGVDWKW